MFEKIYTSFYLKEDHSDEDKLLDEAISDFVLDKELDDVLDEDLLEEGFFFNKDKSEKIESSKNPKQVIVTMKKLAEYFKTYMGKITKNPNFIEVYEEKNNVYAELGEYSSGTGNRLYLYDCLKSIKFPNTINSFYQVKDNHKQYVWISALNNTIILIIADGSPRLEFKWLFDSSYGNELPYNSTQISKLLSKDYLDLSTSYNVEPISLRTNSIYIKIKKGFEESFSKTSLEIFKNVEIKGSKILFKRKLNEDIDESILDEGFIFNKNKSERIKMSKNPEQVAKVLSKLAESFKEYMDKATHVDKFCRVGTLGKNGFTVQPSYPSKLNAQVFYNKLSGYHFPSAINSRSDKDGSFELYGQFSFINGMLIYINYLNDGNPYNANVLFKWVFDSTYGGSVPYTVQQLVKLLGKKYINPAGLSPIALTDRSISVLVDKGQEEQFRKDALQIFKNPSYDIVFKKNKIIFNKKGLKESFEEIEKESSLIREDYTLLEEGIKDIFNNIRNAPVTIKKLIKVKQDF